MALALFPLAFAVKDDRVVMFRQRDPRIAGIARQIFPLRPDDKAARIRMRMPARKTPVRKFF